MEVDGRNLHVPGFFMGRRKFCVARTLSIGFFQVSRLCAPATGLRIQTLLIFSASAARYIRDASAGEGMPGYHRHLCSGCFVHTPWGKVGIPALAEMPAPIQYGDFMRGYCLRLLGAFCGLWELAQPASVPVLCISAAIICFLPLFYWPLDAGIP